jgi:hypothetical protein
MANTLKFGNGEWYGKKDTILAYNDENSNYKPLPFDFSRASKATVVNKDGLIEEVGSGQPRIDYKDDSKGALLLEPNRTNLITYSENLNGSGWSNTGATITENQSISPDGSLNADLIELDSNLDRLAAVLGSTGGTYTFSFYIKAKEGESGVWRTRVNGDSTLWQNTQVNDTEWTRVTQTFTKTGSGNIVVYPAYRVDGTSTLFNAYIYGAQLEQGSYATSYIPTSGSSVTRVADSCSQTTPDGVIGQTEGTIYAEVNVSSIESVGVYSAFRIYGTSGNELAFIMYPTGRIQATVFNGGSLVVNINDNNYGLTSGIHKIAFAYKQNDYILYVDGFVVGSEISATVPTVNDFDLSHSNGGSMKYNQTKLYNTRLSNSELAALTQV